MPRSCFLILLFATAVWAEDKSPPPKVFGPNKIQDVYRVLLNRDALLLESINKVIHEKDVQDGHVSITAGSVQECTYHYVTSTALKSTNAFKTVKGPLEILNGGGIIADGVPHIHITLATAGGNAFGGHLENGCRVLYLAEITIEKYAGQRLTRKPNEQGTSILQAR